MRPIEYAGFLIVIVVVTVIALSMIRNPQLVDKSKGLLIDIIYWIPGLTQAAMQAYGNFPEFLSTIIVPTVPVIEKNETQRPPPIGTGVFDITVCNKGCDYTDLLEAVDNANDGNIIRVMESGMKFELTYNSLAFYQKSNIQMYGNGSQIVPKDRGRPDYGISISEGYNITISNFTIANFAYGIRLMNSDRININDMIFNYNTRGIYLLGSKDIYITNGTYFDNTRGIHLESSSYNNMTNNTLNENTIGIFMTKSNNNIIINASIYQNDEWGIDLYSSDYNTLKDSEICYNGNVQYSYGDIECVVSILTASNTKANKISCPGLTVSPC